MKTLKLILTLVAVLVLTSCEHKDLCYHHPHTVTLKVRFDWRDAPDANPEGMCVYFYPEDGSEPRRADFSNMVGGEIDLNVGKYRVITYNNDTEAVIFDGRNSFDTHRAATRRGSVLEPVMGPQAGSSSALLASGAENQSVVICPDMMWGCSAIDVEITESGVSYICVPMDEKDEWLGLPVVNTEQVITLYPHEMLCTYTYEIRNVEGIERISQVCGSLSGMAPAITLGDEQLDVQPVTIPFESKIDGTHITGKFFTFGHHPDNADPHRVVLYLWLKTGEKYYLGLDDERFDVTTQIHSATDRRHVHFIIDDIDLDAVISQPDIIDSNQGGGDFSPTVDDWAQEDKTLTI